MLVRGLAAAALVATLFLTPAFSAFADAAGWVNGYTRKDGTYVQGHYRSSPDGNPYNNCSFPGNTNPYTGKTATGDPDTYLSNYYNRSGSSAASYYSAPYTSSYVPDYSFPSYSLPSLTPTLPLRTEVSGGYRSYGFLYCDSSHYKKSDACLPLPAFAQAATVGDGFTCRSGYYLDGTQCLELPQNATANLYGQSGYSCNAGYVQQGSNCLLPVDYCRVSANASYDPTTGKCQCPAGQGMGTDGRCATIEMACKQRFGGWATAASDTECTCLSGATWNVAGTMCTPTSPTTTATPPSRDANEAERIAELQARIEALTSMLAELKRGRR